MCVCVIEGERAMGYELVLWECDFYLYCIAPHRLQVHATVHFNPLPPISSPITIHSPPYCHTILSLSFQYNLAMLYVIWVCVYSMCMCEGVGVAFARQKKRENCSS